MIRRLMLVITMIGLSVGWALSLTPGSFPFFAQLNAALYALWLPSAASAQIDPRITIIDIDDHTLSEHGRWPWPRTQLAQLIARLTETEAAVIGLDILLPEADKDDSYLGSVMSDPRIVAASAWAITQTRRDSWPSASRGLTPSATLGTLNQGHITPIHDADGQIRRLAPVICHLDDCYPALAARMLEMLTRQPLELRTEGNSEQLCTGALCQRFDLERLSRIPYRTGLTFNHISAAEVLAGQARIAPGSLVLVGTSATGLGDLVATPLSMRTPGVEVHGHMLSGWMDNIQLHSVRHGEWINLLCISTLLLAALYFSLSPRRFRLPGLAISATATLPPLLLWFSAYWLPPLPILWGLACTCTLLLLGRLTMQQQEKARLSAAFAHYIPDSVMTQLLENGASLDHLDACDTDVSIMFVDIRGFTQMTEQLGADAVVQLTRHVFTELTSLIHASEGTLDKFIGDAVMAFWGAPNAQDDHADRALSCAKEILAALPAINAELAQQGLPRIDLTIGLDAGKVTSGNMGAQQRRAYTVIGSPVNRAARIQALACDLDQPIMLGPGLYDRLTDVSRLERQGEFGLKGFSRPVTVYRPAPSDAGVSVQ